VRPLHVTQATPAGGDWELYGYCISPLGPDCDEWGYASLNELATVRNRLGLGIERDLHWQGTMADAFRIHGGAR
jgi:hypothetical protein